MKRTAKYIIILLTLSINISSDAYGQATNKLFSDYLYPELERRTFVVNPQMFYNNSDGTNNDNLEIDFAGLYSKIGFTRKRQSQMSFSFNSGFLNRGRNDYKDFFGRMELSHDYKFYDKPKRYLRLRNRFSASCNTPRLLIEGNPVFPNSNDLVFTLNPELNLGIGRIEIVTDLWQAINILDALKGEKLLLKELDDSEIIKLGKEIADILNTRNEDFRHETITEQERLINYFFQNGLVDPLNPRFYPVLLDIWNYEGFIIRRNGKATEFGPELIYTHRIFDFDLKHNYSYNYQGLSVNHYNYQCISKNWQFNLSAIVESGISAYIYNLSENSGKSFRVRASSNFTLAYYQSYRTHYTMSLNFYSSFNTSTLDQNNSITSNSSHFFRASLSPFINHYFSPNIRLSMLGIVRLSKNTQFDAHQEDVAFSHSNSINFTIDYFFF